MQHWTPDLAEQIQRSATDAGFALCGVAGAPASESPAGAETADRFATWIEHGRAGEMEYLKRRAESGELLRRSARVALPWARSVIVCAYNYNVDGPTSLAPAPVDTGWIARYAWAGTASGTPTDYHTDLLARLTQVEASLREMAPEHQSKAYVDTGPLLERDFAARAGVGWVGKNTCILNQQQGSWLLLAVIVSSLPVGSPVAMLAPDRCGSCTRCIDACPTGALTEPRQMDARLCIAYLTIEKKGEIPDPLRPLVGRQVFGCDICQEVCPWNGGVVGVPSPIGAVVARPELINPPLSWLATLTQEDFRRLFRGSPLERTKRHRLQRNVAIAMGNSGDSSFVPQLKLWLASDDSVLAESAGWALAQLTGGEQRSASINPELCPPRPNPTPPQPIRRPSTDGR